MSDWKKYKLGDVAQIIGGGTPSTTKEEYWNGEIGWLTPRDLTGYSFKYISKGERNITEEGLKNSSARLMPQGTVLMTSRAPIGYLAIAGDELCTNQGFKSFIVDEVKINNEYLYYLLRSNIDRIKSLGTGSTFAEVSASILKSFEIEIPDLPTQKQIAQILTSLDAKIELNLQMNQTLEAMAQAIFKEWCTSENEEIPDGWNVRELAELADVSSSKRIFREEYALSGVPFYRGKEVTQLSNGESISTELFISNERYEEIKEKFGVPQVGEILITSVGTIGSIWLVDNDSPFYFKDGNVTWIKNYKTQVSGGFIYQWLKTKDAQEQIKSVTIGSTQQALTISALKGLKILIPDEQTVISVAEQLEKINAKRINNINQIHSLAQTRDTLLSNLMSGNIAVMNT